MTILEWEKESLDSSFAKKMRREIRTHRREQGRGGHEFNFNDIRALWVSGNNHVILSHELDRSWQFWWRHPEESWFLQSWHRILADAKAEADKPRIFSLPKPAEPHGICVFAEWVEPYSGNSPIVINCSSQHTALEIVKSFQAIGCQATIKTVA